MADENKVAEVATASSPEESEQPLEQPEEKPEEKEIEESKPQEKEGEAEVQPKKTRIEKRIEQLEQKKSGLDELLSSLKAGQQETVKSSEIPPELLKGYTPSLYREGETEITVDELEKRIAQRENFLRQQIKQEIQYENTVKSHISELEGMKEADEFKDEDFKKEFEDTYQKANWVLGINGQPVFIGAVSPKEAFELTKKKFESLKAKLVGSVAKTLTEQVGSSAVSPSLGGEKPEADLEELKSKLWKSPGQVARLLEEKLSKS